MNERVLSKVPEKKLVRVVPHLFPSIKPSGWGRPSVQFHSLARKQSQLRSTGNSLLERRDGGVNGNEGQKVRPQASGGRLGPNYGRQSGAKHRSGLPKPLL